MWLRAGGLWLCASVMLSSCGGGSSTGSSASLCTPGRGDVVSISGQVTFDRVHHAAGGALDYTNITAEPARGVVVEVLCNTVLASAISDDTGHYSISVASGTLNLKVRARAQMLQTGTPAWNVRVVNNTAGDALYVLDSDYFNNDTGMVVDLHADSGWGGASYTATRAAAPFAILDSVRDAMDTVRAVDANVVFPALDIHWSILNSTDDGGNLALGQIGTSYFNGAEIYLLGKANDDTDEYDHHVVIHEWGHYFEHYFSRADNIGGHHALGDILDIRVAFGEGFGNAWSAMVSQDPVYKDSLGDQQASGFDFSLEDNCGSVARGFFSECSVQSILYDLFDTSNEAADALAFGWGPLHEVLVGAQKTTPAMTSIFSFIDALKDARSEDAAIDNLLTAQGIDSVADEYGSSQSSNLTVPFSVDALPVYTQATIGGADVEVCSSNEFQVYNGYEGSRFIRFHVPGPQALSIVANRVSGAGNQPWMELYKNGELIDYALSAADGTETMVTPVLIPGDYVLEIYDYGNNAEPGVGSTCYRVSL